MVLPLLVHLPRPPLSLSSSSSSASWSSEALLLVNAQAFSNISTRSSATSTRGFLNTEGGYGVRDCLLPPGASRLSFSASPLSLPSSMAPSVRCASHMEHPYKRLCKATELSKCRSHILISDVVVMSDCKHSLDSNFKVSAFTRHDSSEIAVAELEQSADDGLQLQNTCYNGKKTARSRMKSAEELHFEAVRDYCLRYEDEVKVDSHHVNDVSGDVAGPGASLPEAPQSPVCALTAVLDSGAGNTPVNESKDVSGVFPWHGDGKAVQLQATGCTAVLEETSMQNELEKHIPSLDYVTEQVMPIKVSQSLRNANEKSAKGNRSMQMKTVQSGPHKVSARKIAQASEVSLLQSSVAEIRKGNSAGASGLDLLQHQSVSDNGDLQHKKPHCKNEDINSEEESTKFEVNEDLSELQKIRMELNKAAALARRNMRVCEDAVAEAKAQGLSFPKFESLLVEKSWAEALGAEFQKPYMGGLHQFVSQEAAGRVPIYPPPAKLFNAFNSCPFDKVKVVIIGQDPYHGPGQAMGLCFSVEKGTKLPSSLSNIFLEIESDLQCDFPSHGNLEKWAHQGVLLLNTVLTVRDHHANSHAKKGWELFTDAAIRALAQQRSGVVFLLWGNQAQEKLRLITKTCHHVLKAFHPSGISAHKGFFKCRHFSKTNQILVDQGSLPIDWQL